MGAVAKGDLFRDNEPRNIGDRVLRVIGIWGDSALVENVKHWNPTAIGRYTYIKVPRLLSKKYYTKVEPES